MVILLPKYGKLLTSHISPALASTYYSEVFPTLQGLHNDITTYSFYIVSSTVIVNDEKL